MFKVLLNKEAIPEMVRSCYESDSEHILKVHETGENGLEFCITQTICDYILNNIDIYGVFINNKFIGYFGEEKLGNDRYLTGFFVSPQGRKVYKKDFWNLVKDHFNGNFIAGVYSKNEPARKFLTDNGCKFLKKDYSVFGPGEVYIYKENN